MPNRRIIIISVITVIIFVIAVFLWLIFGLIDKKKIENPVIKPPEQTFEDKEQEILDVLKIMDEKKEGLASPEKKEEILNVLQTLDNISQSTNTTSTNAVVNEEKKDDILDVLKKMDNLNTKF